MQSLILLRSLAFISNYLQGFMIIFCTYYYYLCFLSYDRPCKGISQVYESVSLFTNSLSFLHYSSTLIYNLFMLFLAVLTQGLVTPGIINMYCCSFTRSSSFNHSASKSSRISTLFLTSVPPTAPYPCFPSFTHSCVCLLTYPIIYTHIILFSSIYLISTSISIYLSSFCNFNMSFHHKHTDTLIFHLHSHYILPFFSIFEAQIKK